MADIADDGLMLHPAHLLGGDDVVAARGGDENISDIKDIFKLGDLVAVHGRLQRADRVDLGDDHAGTLTA